MFLAVLIGPSPVWSDEILSFPDASSVPLGAKSSVDFVRLAEYSSACFGAYKSRAFPTYVCFQATLCRQTIQNGRGWGTN